jgi:uncharacterized membrane protein
VFTTILGIPAHPLLIHAAVVFIPLLIVGAIVYAAIPKFRPKIDWAVLALAIIGPFAALFAKLSGQSLKTQLIDKKLTSPQLLKQITVHNGYGNDTFWWTLVLGVATLALLAYHWRTRAQETENGTVRAVSTVVLLVLGVLVGYYVFRTGDTGAHMVWSGI